MSLFNVGVDLMQNGGSLVLAATDYMIGPGHTGTYERDGIEIMTFHYYDSRRSGLSWIAERQLTVENGWPVAGQLLSSYGTTSVPTQKTSDANVRSNIWRMLSNCWLKTAMATYSQSYRNNAVN